MCKDNSYWDELIVNLLPDLDLTEGDLTRIRRKLKRERFDRVFHTAISGTINFRNGRA